MSASLARVIELASLQSGIPVAKLSPTSAIDQDMGMSGGDVSDFAEALSTEFGKKVWEWPWSRFAMLDEGLGCLFPIALTWQLVTWPLRGSFEYPSGLERLELGHIAAVIEKGEWFEP